MTVGIANLFAVGTTCCGTPRMVVEPDKGALATDPSAFSSDGEEAPGALASPLIDWGFAVLGSAAADAACASDRLVVTHRPRRAMKANLRGGDRLVTVEGCGKRLTYLKSCEPQFGDSIAQRRSDTLIARLQIKP